MDNVYIPTHWLEASAEVLDIRRFRLQYEIDHNQIHGFFKEQARLQVLWLEQQIPIAKTRELLTGE